MLISVIFISCSNSDDIENIQIVGTYNGTITANTEGKTDILNKHITASATAIVRIIDDKIEVTFFNDNFRHNILLNIFEEGSLVRTCLTGSDFEMEYGHILGHGINDGNMQSNYSQWMQHLDLEHKDSDEHNGIFNKIESSFDYKIEIDNTDYHFLGIKEYTEEEIYF